VVLDHATAKDNHARLLGEDSGVVQPLDVLDEVNDETTFLPGVEVDDIAESSVSEGRAVDLDVILPAPVVDGVFMIDLLAD